MFYIIILCKCKSLFNFCTIQNPVEKAKVRIPRRLIFALW